MSIKITIPNSSSDVLTFGSGNTPTAAQIAGIDSGSSNGQLALYTTASGTSTERVRVDSSGNVGIGLTSPAYKLEASSSTNNYIGVTCTTDGNAASRFKNNQRDWLVGVLGGASGAWAVYDITASAERMRIDSGGRLLVAKTTTNDGDTGFMFEPIRDGAGNGRLTITQSATTNSGVSYSAYSSGAAAYRFYVGMGGTIFATITTISAISDIRYKENVRDLNVGLAEVMALKPRLYDWKEGKGADIKNARGFIAQEFEEVFPDLIDEWKDPAPEGEDPYKSVRADLIPVLVKAIQEQQAIIQTLTDRITALEGAK